MDANRVNYRGNHPQAGVRPYFPELDGVRALAALMVMVFHFSQDFFSRRYLVLGQTGVDLFFVLSGFLISTILLQAPHGDWHEIRNFYIRRTLRIFPLYYGYLVAASFVTGVSAWFWVYLENYPIALNVAHVAGPNHFWSLAVEEQFYLVWPFLILFWPRRWLPHAMAAAIAGSVLLRVVLMHSAVSEFYLTFTRLDALAAGSLLALAWQRGAVGSRRALFVFGAAAFGALLLLGARFSGGHGLGWVRVTKYLAAAGLYTSLIGLLLATGGTVLHRVLRSRPMRGVGRVSYGLYVFHPFVLFLLATYGRALPLLVKATVFAAASYLISVASFYGFEKRFTDLKQKLAPEKPFPRGATIS